MLDSPELELQAFVSHLAWPLSLLPDEQTHLVAETSSVQAVRSWLAWYFSI